VFVYREDLLVCPASDPPFTTVTHARLRALQGDRAGAAELLQAILEQDPANDEARWLLASLGRPAAPPSPAAADDAEPRREPAAAGALGSMFRARLEAAPPAAARAQRLRLWLRRIASKS